MECFDHLRLVSGEPELLQFLCVFHELKPCIFSVFMDRRSQSFCGECMNRRGQLRKNFESIAADFLARFLRPRVSVDRLESGCDGGCCQCCLSLELPYGLFGRRIAEKIGKIE